ncbi:MAG TPA: ATP-binding protein [Verrucomicrobiae bacterium]|nr:ATP-binding protein [Verrucomicrobiae bacterium]
MKRSFSTGTARRTWLRQHRHELQMTALLLVMVVLPSAVLGTFAWRAIQSEKLAWRERERQTYQEIAKLAAHGIDQQLRDIERDWSATLDSLTQAARSRRGLAARAAAFTSGHALVDGGYVLSVSGGVLYPPALHGESAPTWDAPDADEREQFDALMNDGEQFEYVSHRYDRAIAAYREARRHVHSDELRSMFETAIGRAQLKAGDREGAIVTYRQVLQRYPEVRDLDRMVVRFLAQYQIAAALGELGRDHEAMDTLLALHRDLLARSDDITALQYAYYADLIRGLSARLLSTPGLKGGAAYEAEFQRLAERTRSGLSRKYLAHVLMGELEESVVRRRHWSDQLHYVSDRNGSDPFLLAYRELHDPAGVSVIGLVAVQVDLDALRKEIIPSLLGHLDVGHEVALAVVGDEGDYVLGTESPVRETLAMQTLADPFDFWRVALGPRDPGPAERRMGFRTGLWMATICVLLLMIVGGAAVSLRRAQRQAQLARARATFVSNVSHELRTPIASIKMFSELLERELLDEDGRPAAKRSASLPQYLGLIRHESDRLARLIESVLDFSRLERGGRTFRFELCDPAEVFETAVESFRPRAEAEGFQLQVELAEALPPLRLDTDAICQVVLNLLGNAVKYSDAVKEIQVRASREGAWVVLDVEDRGIGIAARDLARVFDQFYRVDQRLDSGHGGGLGLGLTLARAIARAHHGEILVHSEPGRGSTFRVLLPIPHEPAGRAVPAPSGRPAEAGR